MKKLALLFWLLPWLALAQVGGGQGPIGGCAGPLNGCAGPLGQVTQTYVLDQLAAYPAAAYSVRQMTAGQYLPAYDMTVRRQSDNATANIGFSGGLLNTTALTSFCAATNCFVVTWKNQGSLGSSVDATQSTAASQPPIVSSGVVETQGAMPAILFQGSQINLSISGLAGFIGATTLNAVTQQTALEVDPLFLNSLGLGGAAINFDSGGSGAIQIGRFGQSGANFSANMVANTPTILSFTSALGVSGGSFTASGYKNGTSIGTQTVTGYAAQGSGAAIGLVTASYTQNYYLPELVVFQSVWGAGDAATLRINEAKFFGVSGVTQ